MTKRILSLLLVVLMLSALVACGGGDEVSSEKPGSNVASGSLQGTDTDTDTNTGTTSDRVQPDVPLDEMSGKNFIIIQHGPIEDPFGYSQDSFAAELAAERISEISNAWGCTISFEQVAYNDEFVSTMQAKQYADNAGDLIFSNNNAQLRKALGTGGDTSLMIDLLAMDDIVDFWNTDKWGNITSRETMMAGGTFYGLTPALWYNCTPLPYYSVVYSKDLLASFETENPQELWEQEAWDRDAMLDIITSCYDDTMGEPIFGMSAHMTHMVRASYLSAGVDAVVIDKINADGSVDWTYGMADPMAVEALQWLKNSITANRKYFNNGADPSGSWTAHNAYVSGMSAMCLTAYRVVFDNIAMQCENFALIPWAGADANTLSGFYENCYSVAIPIFAQDFDLSAHLMAHLFEGLGEVESTDDIVKYYKETYFESDLDVSFLLMEGANLQYSYWPNGGDAALNTIAGGLMSASSVKTLVEKTVPTVSEVVETHLVPNAVALEKYRQNGYFD